MKYLHIILFSLLCTFPSWAQTGVVEGRVVDKLSGTPLEFVNIVVRQKGHSGPLKGGHSDADGRFRIAGLADGQYVLSATYLGFREEQRTFAMAAHARQIELGDVALTEDDRLLGEAVVTGQRSEMVLEVDRKSFNVDQQISNAGGSASDVLENIPSVEVDTDGNVSLRGNTSVEVWINGRQSGLTSDNQGDILQQIPAESIERIEVIDNPSAKFSAEGSAGIINIVLKKDLKPGYYGSVQVGGDTNGGANTSFNINYNTRRFDAYLNLGYRHREGRGGRVSEQIYAAGDTYQRYASKNTNRGNNLFSRAGLTWHATKNDDVRLQGMLMAGGRRSVNLTPYHYGQNGAATDSYVMSRLSHDGGDMLMYNVGLDYHHIFSETHFLDAALSHNRWRDDHDTHYQDSTCYFLPPAPTDYAYQSLPSAIRNRRWEAKLDYENQLSDAFKLQAGYQGNFSHEDSPQESWTSQGSWEAATLVEDKSFYNRFIYDNHIHALYATATFNTGRFGLMAGLRGEYWRVRTESYTWAQEHDVSLRDTPFKKDYFQLFPSIFLSYQLSERNQLQINYTRRLRRPWGGQLNSFKNTRDATMVSYGNPLLTPEYSHSFSLNLLRTWEQHSLLVSAYYRPTTDVMQRISWQDVADGVMYQTHVNVAKSLSSGLELTLKNKFFRILDLTTNANFYYYKLNGFSFDVSGQTVSGQGEEKFTWNARMQASLQLPWDISVQATGRYNSRQAIAQGYRRANGNLDLGLRKTFLGRKLTLSANCRDVFNTRRFETYTSSDTFWRHQKNWRNRRTFSLTLSWNFGNAAGKKPKNNQRGQDEDFDSQTGYEESE